MPLWFPDLTADLVDEGWHTLHARAGITPDTYGTARVLAKSPNAERHAVAEVSTGSTAGLVQTRAIFEILDGESARRYEELDLTFADPSDIRSSNVLQTLREAIVLVHFVPSLGVTVARLVRSIHVLRAPGPEYDVSHSDPEVPFSIFLSIPAASSPNSAIRVAESLIHEAMHLQLTLVESVIPLTTVSGERFYSPWLKKPRPANGILHGLYVFRAIDEWFQSLLCCGVGDENAERHIVRRREPIADEINTLNGIEESAALTRTGRVLATRLFRDGRLATSRSHSVYAAGEFPPRRPARH